MQLVIAEKPSVAQSIAKVLGVTSRKDGYLEGNGYVVSWCVGHLIELAATDTYNPSYSKWVRDDLPIVPQEWQFTVSEGTKKQYAILKSLMERSDVDSLVEATDAGREGELIFRLVYHQAKCKKPFSRLWISSMEDSAIKKGFDNLLPSDNYDRLYDAALCRSKADWLVGINGTRLFTTLYNGKLLNVGRVMTPTLALLIDREATIGGFQKVKFYTVDLDCGTFFAASERIDTQADAERLREDCVGKPVTVTLIDRQEKTKNPPKLYDLTTLQREANRFFGYTAQQTLDCVQQLYEKKLTTYPRTDSQFLTEDMAAGLPALCEIVVQALPFANVHPLTITAAQVVNGSKVSDHHAIIPTNNLTLQLLAELPPEERNVLHLIMVRLLCAVGEKHCYTEINVTLDCADTTFTTKGQAVLSDGWLAIDQAFKATLSEKAGTPQVATVLSSLSQEQQFAAIDVVIKEGSTTPPKHFTEDSLLSAMERAGADDFVEIEDDDTKKSEFSGLGTPATRAGIIEKLVKGNFVERKSKSLIPTNKGIDLIKVLPDTVKSAKLTAQWESSLRKVECGELSANDFMSDIVQMINELVKSYDGVTVDSSVFSSSDSEAVGSCPRCKKSVVEGKKSFYCTGYNADPPCSFALWKENIFFKNKRKELTKRVACALLKDGRVRMTGLFSEKSNTTYDAVILLDDTGDKYVNFKMEFPQKTTKTKRKY